MHSLCIRKGMLFMLFIISMSMAQPKPSTKEDRLKDLKEKLELTKVQIAKVGTILDSNQKKVDVLQDKKVGDRIRHMEAMKVIMDEGNAQIEKILTKAQKKKFAEMRKEREKHHPLLDHERPPLE